jgi:orotate phosphoribosyltransferase
MTVASTPELESDRRALIDLIAAEAVFHGDFTLSSGKKATYYVDMRKLTLDHRAAPAIGRLVLDAVRDLDVDAVGGLTLGADPIANAVMHASVAAGTPVDAFVVRKEPKDHGRGRQIEGAEVAGKRVVIVEDTSTTGGSP